ncbi:MAG: O-antigen ligase family protein [Bulleidia sp.]|nr:O-antigen ligase family protein [Bulleidia sp.]
MFAKIYSKCRGFFTKYHRVFTYLFYISAIAIYMMELSDPDAFDILINASQKETIKLTAWIILGIVCAGSAVEHGNKITVLLNGAFWLIAIYYTVRNHAFALPFTVALITGAWGSSDRTALLPLMPGSLMMFDQWQLKIFGFAEFFVLDGLDVLLNRKNLFYSYFIDYILMEVVLLPAPLNWTAFRPFYLFHYMKILAVWFVILFIKDIVTRKATHSFYQIFMYTFMILITVTTFFGAEDYFPTSMKYVFVQFMFCYLFFSYRAHVSKKTFDRVFGNCAMAAVQIITVAITVSLIIYYRLMHGLSVPAFMRANCLSVQPHDGSSNKIRYVGLFEYLVSAGLFSSFSIMHCLYLHHKGRMKLPVLLAICALDLYMIKINDTRAALLVCIVIVLTLLIVLLRKLIKKKPLRIVLFCTLVAAGIAGVILTHPEAMQQLKADPYEYLNAKSSSRLFIWKTAYALTLERPYYGYGWGNSMPIPAAIGHAHCHDIFFSTLLWSGFPGLIHELCFIILCIAGIIHRRNIKDRNRIWMLMYVAAIFAESWVDMAVVGEPSYTENGFFWLALGYLLSRPLKKQPKEITE